MFLWPHRYLLSSISYTRIIYFIQIVPVWPLFVSFWLLVRSLLCVLEAVDLGSPITHRRQVCLILLVWSHVPTLPVDRTRSSMHVCV